MARRVSVPSTFAFDGDLRSPVARHRARSDDGSRTVPRRRITWCLLAVIALLATLRPASTHAAAPAGATVITNASAIRLLTTAEADERRPARIRGVITAVHADFGMLFIQDASGGIYVHQAAVNSLLQPGDLLDVQGTTGPGLLTPVLVADRTELVRRGEPLPPAPLLSAEELWTGRADSERIATRGYVARATAGSGSLELVVVGGRHAFYVFAPTATASAALELPGAEIELRGTVATKVDDARRVQSITLFIPFAGDLRVIRPAETNLQAAPPVPIDRTSAGADPVLDAPVRIRGTVTLGREKVAWLEAGEAAIRCELPPNTTASPDTELELLGNVVQEGPARRFEATRILSRRPAPPLTPHRLAGTALRDWRMNGRLVEVDAGFVHRVDHPDARSLIFTAGDRTFEVHVPGETSGGSSIQFPAGAIVRLAGVLELTDHGPGLEPSVAVLVRSSASLLQVGAPPWPIRRTLGMVSALGLALSLGLAALASSHRRLREAHRQVRAANTAVHELNLALEKRVGHRTAELEQANTRLEKENRVRRLAEQAVIDREGRLRDAQALAHVGSFTWTATGDRTTWSDELYRILGYDPDHLAPGIPAYLGHVHVEDRTRVEARLEAARREGTPFEDDHRIVRADGKERWVTARVRAVPGPDGEPPARLEGIVQDITDRRALEAQLLQSRKLEAVGTLAGGIAHEFNNILAAMLGHTELARRHSTYNAAALESLAEVLDAGHRARLLVRQMLAFSRPQDPERRAIQLSQVADKSLRLLRAALPDSVELRTRFAPDLPPVHGDANQLEQVIINLVTNAAQAIPGETGWVEVAVDALLADERTVARVPALRPGHHYVRLAVADNGAGIPPHALPRIFEPFFTTKPVGEGTGLGLSVVHGIVTAHQAAIDVESSPGTGTCFRLYFAAAPLEASPPAEPEPAPAETSMGAESNRVLFVDDEPALTKAATRLLNRAGFRVTSTLDPLDALDRFRAAPHDFDVVVSDFTMPRKNGLELGRELLLVRPGIPIVLCTGYATNLSRHEVLRAGMTDLIYKPVDAQTLESVVREAIHRHRPEPATPAAHSRTVPT